MRPLPALSRRAVHLALAACTLLLAACGNEPPPPKAVETEVPEELAANVKPAQLQSGAQQGTPLEQRVATLGLLNKRNNLSQDLVLKPGESRRVGNVVVKLASCERTAPWESPAETGAFVQVLVEERNAGSEDLRWHKVFSGWLFKNSPSLNVVEHPIYDVWVKDCEMNFPGGSPVDSAEESSAP